MTQPQVPVDSPIPWVRDHITRYVDSDGADGHYLLGLPTLVLTTIGRRSGTPRRTGATYGVSGSDYIVIASDGGAPKHPHWYLNLLANPDVEVQVGADRFHAVARVTTGDERERLWQLMTAMSPTFAELQQRTTRLFPIVLLRPRRDPPSAKPGAAQRLALNKQKPTQHIQEQEEGQRRRIP